MRHWKRGLVSCRRTEKTSQFGHTRIAPSRRHTHEHSTSAIPTLSHARCWAPWWQDMSGNARRLSRACKSAPCRRFMTGDDGRLETPCATRCIRGRGLFKRSRRMRSSIGDPSLTAHLSLVRVVTVTVLFRPRRTHVVERRTTDPPLSDPVRKTLVRPTVARRAALTWCRVALCRGALGRGVKR